MMLYLSAHINDMSTDYPTLSKCKNKKIPRLYLKIFSIYVTSFKKCFTSVKYVDVSFCPLGQFYLNPVLSSCG